MRYWHPLTAETVARGRGMAARRDRAAAALSAILDDDHRLVARRLGTTRRSARALRCRRAASAAIRRRPGFIAALAAADRRCRWTRSADRPARLLFSAHGLPLKIVRAGDPYPQRSRSDRGGGGRRARRGPGSTGGSAIRAGSGRWPGSGRRSMRRLRRAGRDGWRSSSRRSRSCRSIRRRWSSSTSIIASSPRTAACRPIAGCRRSAPIRASSRALAELVRAESHRGGADRGIAGAVGAGMTQLACGCLSLAEGAAHHRA